MLLISGRHRKGTIESAASWLWYTVQVQVQAKTPSGACIRQCGSLSQRFQTHEPTALPTWLPEVSEALRRHPDASCTGARGSIGAFFFESQDGLLGLKGPLIYPDLRPNNMEL